LRVAKLGKVGEKQHLGHKHLFADSQRNR